jgi:uncharacterized protein (TIGR02271 family)
VNRGEVRIRKEVLTTTQTIEVPVTREELVVERVPVSGEVAVVTILICCQVQYQGPPGLPWQPCSIA